MKTVLYVDDEQDLRCAISEVLSFSDYRVVEACNCAEALACLEQPIDIALLDYKLPDGTGIELLNKIRVTMPDLPVIIITAYGTEDLAVKSFRTGATDYIKKPPEFNYLLRRMSELMGGEVEDAEGSPECFDSHDDLKLACIVEHLKANHSDEITLDRLAEIGDINKFRLSRLFNRKFGAGYQTYLNGLRIGHAKELLKNRGLSILEIADAAGFKSLSQFERVFKSMEGLPPRELRRNMQLSGIDQVSSSMPD